MYNFPDRDGTSLTLRREGTAGTVRASSSIMGGRSASTEVFLHRTCSDTSGQGRTPPAVPQFVVESLGRRTLVQTSSHCLLWRLLSDLVLPDLHLRSIAGSSNDRAAYKLSCFVPLTAGIPPLRKRRAAWKRSLRGWIARCRTSSCNRISTQADGPSLS